MPKISAWKNEKLGKDFVWIDRHCAEQYNIGGVGIYVHKYLSAGDPNLTNDATQPIYTNQSVLNIQDLLFGENRDRKYSSNIYRLRGHYNAQDLDLDLTQFGLMIAAGTLFITFHTKTMVDVIGRKLMSGDVLELPNLKEFYSLDETIPVALKRYYVVQEGTRPAAGFGWDWWSHIWRVKCTPLVDSQEYSQILNQIVTNTDGDPVLVNGNTVTYGNITSSTTLYQNMNDAIVTQAEYEVPASGYNTDALWTPLFVNGDPSQGTLPSNASPQQKFTGYLVNNGEAANGYPVTPAISFPDDAEDGTYILRQDYFPARLYVFHNSTWEYVSTEQRTKLTPGTGKTLRDKYVNNSNTFTNSSGNVEPVIQNLSNLLRLDKGGDD